MALIEWREEFAVGVPAVDYEHRELIALINETHGRLERQEAGTGIADFLGEIYAKIAAHFALEERIMRERRYDQYADHKADHERLLDEIREIMEFHEASATYDEPALAERLNDWFTVHFKTKDARLHKFLGA